MINSYAILKDSIRRNLDKYPEDPLDSDKVELIRKTLKDVNLLVIDEMSMLTAATLNLIDLNLRQAFKKKFAFGGKDIALVGEW